MKLGKGSAPDIIAIGLSATDYVGHTFGPGGGEMCLQLHSLDRDLGDFLRFLDRSGLDYSVMLTADHGGETCPSGSACTASPTPRAPAATSLPRRSARRLPRASTCPGRC